MLTPADTSVDGMLLLRCENVKIFVKRPLLMTQTHESCVPALSF